MICNFLSVLILQNGDVLHHPLLDSHADLVRYFKLPDTNAHISHFAKAELTPADWLDPSTWTWRIDDEVRPIWLNDVEAQAEAKARAIAGRMILKNGEHDLIIEGCWIIGGTAKVCDVRSGWIRRVQDFAQVRDVRDSAQVRDVMDSAQVTNVGGSAQVTNVRGSAQVTNVGGSAQVRDVWGFAQVTNVWDSAQVTNVWGSAQVRVAKSYAKQVTLDASAKRALKRGLVP